ncbi:MAG: hypothetical protein FWH42_02510 [Dehalococcoidia bacterium]|nr:hypothetical protein [Dehalococcoidia bacterium]
MKHRLGNETLTLAQPNETMIGDCILQPYHRSQTVNWLIVTVAHCLHILITLVYILSLKWTRSLDAVSYICITICVPNVDTVMFRNK